MPDWITVRTPGDGGRVTTQQAPFDPATTDALVRAARTIRRGPARASARPRSIYVILLELAEGKHGLYVGMTGRTPEERYCQHKRGYKASHWARRYGVGLLPALYRHLNPLDWDSATRAEVDLANALRGTGIFVKQA